MMVFLTLLKAIFTGVKRMWINLLEPTGEFRSQAVSHGISWLRPLAAAVAIVLVLVAVPAAQAGQDGLGVEEILTLLEVGVSEDQIFEKLEADGWPSEVSEADLARLRRSGAGERLLTRLKRSASKPLSVDDVVLLVEQGFDSLEIIERIESSGSTFDLSMDDVLSLAKKGVPKDVLRVMRQTGRSSGSGETPAGSEQRDEPGRQDPGRQRQRRQGLDGSSDGGSIGTKDVIELTSQGVSAGEIVDRILKADATFVLSLQDVSDLRGANVSFALFRVLRARQSLSQGMGGQGGGQDRHADLPAAL